MKSFIYLSREKVKVLGLLFIISVILLICFPAYGFLFPNQEVGGLSSSLFELFFIIVGFGFVVASALWEILINIITHTSTTSFIQPLTMGVLIVGLIGQIIYFYLIACVYVYLKNRFRKNSVFS